MDIPMIAEPDLTVLWNDSYLLYIYSIALFIGFVVNVDKLDGFGTIVNAFCCSSTT